VLFQGWWTLTDALLMLMARGVHGSSRRTSLFAAEITAFTAQHRPSTPLRPCMPIALHHEHCTQSTMPTTIEEFESVWPRIRADLQAHCEQYKLPQDSLDWFTKVP
jgi:hypothetical protein